jgi:hypothetical protein
VCEEAVFLTFSTGGRRRLDELLDEVAVLADGLRQAAAAAGAELDGYELILDEVTFFLYGPDCARVWNAVCPLAMQAPLGRLRVQLRKGGLEAEPVLAVPSA